MIHVFGAKGAGPNGRGQKVCDLSRSVRAECQVSTTTLPQPLALKIGNHPQCASASLRPSKRASFEPGRSPRQQATVSASARPRIRLLCALAALSHTRRTFFPPCLRSCTTAREPQDPFTPQTAPYDPPPVIRAAHVSVPADRRPPLNEFHVYSAEGVLEDKHVVLEELPKLARRKSLGEAVVDVAKKVIDVEKKVAKKVSQKIVEVEKAIPYQEK